MVRKRSSSGSQAHPLVTAIPTRLELKPSYKPAIPSRWITLRAAARVLCGDKQKPGLARVTGVAACVGDP